TGEHDYDEVAVAYRNARLDAEVSPFLFDVPRAFRQADLIVSRSGATTVAEITACGKPSLLIPFPYAIHGHQERNARILEQAGAATVILDAGLTGEALAAAITALLADPGRLGEMGRRSKALGRADSAERIVMACRALVGAGGASAGPPLGGVGAGGARGPVAPSNATGGGPPPGGMGAGGAPAGGAPSR